MSKRKLSDDNLNVYTGEETVPMVVGGLRSLKAFRGALGDALKAGSAKVQVYATDGEGYTLSVASGAKGTTLSVEGQDWPHQPVNLVGDLAVLKELHAAVDTAIARGKAIVSGCEIVRDDNPPNNLSYPYLNRVFRVNGRKDAYQLYR